MTTDSERSCVSEDPDTGTNLLAVNEIDRETARNVSETKRATFDARTGEQRTVFLAAFERDCNLVQTVFPDTTRDRVEYVKYEGDWYFLRVSIV